jgi:alpha-tubulin suppressor-like RCC1 family protein
MTTTLLGSTRFVNQKQYSVSVAYQRDDVVYYNGKWYLCIADSTAGTLPTDTQFFTVWQSAFNWRGEHNNVSTQYQVGDVVSSTANYTTGVTNAGTFTRQARQVYICILAHTSNNTNTFRPVNTTYWRPISLSTYNDGTASVANDNITESWGVIDSNPDKCLLFPNQGRVGETLPCLTRGTNKCQSYSYDRGGLITNSGQWRQWGRNDGQSIASNIASSSAGPTTITNSFFFHDWWRSTSNGGAGVHATPDNKHPRLIQVEQGWNWWLALFNNGEVYHGGLGTSGQSGNRANTTRYVSRVGGTYTEVSVATNTVSHVFRDTRIVMISASGGERANGTHHCLALDEDGQVWSWGYNNYGQLGDNSITNRNIPTLIPKEQFGLTSEQKVVAIWAGGADYGYSFALTDQNKLFGWGYNNYGHLGLGTTSTNVRIPTEVTTQTWTEAGVGTIVKLVTADSQTTQYSTTSILTSKGSIYSAGWNNSGHMMIGNTSQQNAFTVATSGPGSNNTASDVWITNGNACSMYVTDVATKRLFAAGANGGGQLGIVGTNTNYTAAQSCVKSIDSVQTNLTGVTRVSGLGGGNGTNTSVIVATENGWSFAAGHNSYGQLSLGWSGTYHFSVTDTSRENAGQRGFQMVKMPSSLAGNVADVWFMGYADSSSTNYGVAHWKDRQGRVYHAGYNSAYSVSGTQNSEHFNMMRPLITG